MTEILFFFGLHWRLFNVVRHHRKFSRCVHIGGSHFFIVVSRLRDSLTEPYLTGIVEVEDILAPKANEVSRQ